MLDKTLNQPSKFKAKNRVEINDELRGTHNKDIQIRFKTLMLRSILCDYSNAYILVQGTTKVINTVAAGQLAKKGDKKIIFKICTPFTYCIMRISNTQVDDADDIDVVKLIYNLIEYNDSYYGILWQYCRNEPVVNASDKKQ